MHSWLIYFFNQWEKVILTIYLYFNIFNIDICIDLSLFLKLQCRKEKLERINFI